MLMMMTMTITTATRMMMMWMLMLMLMLAINWPQFYHIIAVATNHNRPLHSIIDPFTFM